MTTRDELVQLVTSLRKTGFAEGVHRTHLEQGDLTKQRIYTLFDAIAPAARPAAVTITEQMVERVARHLHLNYPTELEREFGQSDWEELDGDQRSAWTAEARAVLDAAALAQGEDGNG